MKPSIKWKTVSQKIKMAKIKLVKAWEILDSRGDPTIKTKVILDDGIEASVSVPSGTSLGRYEAVELRDKDPNRYSGKGVLKAVAIINQGIGPGLTNVEASLQFEIDRWLSKIDGTKNKSKLGANTILSVSLAVLKASALSSKIPLYQYVNSLLGKMGLQVEITSIPSPVFNVINGGKHGAGNLDFQEFQIIPASAKKYHEALRTGSEIYSHIKDVLVKNNAIHSVGYEGGFAPNLYTNLDALEIIMQAVKNSHYVFGEDIFLGLDVAASVFYSHDTYKIRDKQKPFTTEQFIEYLVDLNNQYHLLLLEDALSDDDWKGWQILTERLGSHVIIVGDDILATNEERFARAIRENACTAILIKPNQIGTFTETLEVVKMAKDNNFKINVSHRSGETDDTTIADFAVGIQSEYVKFGAPARGERVAKYNRLLEIEEELNFR